MLHGPTVFIMGAGASCDSGTPVLRDFLRETRELYKRRADLHYRAEFDLLIDWLDRLRTSEVHVAFNRDNLEDVYSAIELGRQMGLDGFVDLSSAIRRVVLETLDQVPMSWSGNANLRQIAYDLFSRRLGQRASERVRIFKGRPPRPDSVITLNYDILLETSLQSAGVAFDYCLDGGQRDGIAVLKLHGSLNWLRCRRCGESFQVVLPQEAIALLETNQAASDARLRMTTEVLPQVSCKKCQAIGEFDPILIPPTWSKALDPGCITSVWREAHRALGTAARIVFIGYSLPETDSFFRHLLTLGLRANSELEEVQVVDPSSEDLFVQRYRAIFSANRRGSVHFYKSRFSDYMSLREDILQ